jgi:hypothetical protein
LFHLLHLEQDKLVLWVAVTVIFDEEVECLFFATFGKEPSWRLGDEMDGDEHVERGNGLQ